MERRGDAADVDGPSEFGHLRRLGEVLAVAHGHDAERLGGGEHRAVPGAGMVGMAVRDQRAGHGPDGIDVDARDRAIEAGRRGQEEIGGPHGLTDRAGVLSRQRVRGNGAWARGARKRPAPVAQGSGRRWQIEGSAERRAVNP